jgi:hypothetical protein
MNDGDIKFIEGWEAAKNRIWQQPDGLCSGWLSDLPAGVRVPMPATVDMLAFGHAAQADGVSEEDAWAARIVAARELFRAAASSADVIYGQRAERWIIGTFQPVNKKRGDFGSIGAEEFAGDRLTLSPLCRGWLAPAYIATDPTLWGTPEAVSYIDLTINRKWLGAWFGKLSGNGARRRKRGQDIVIEMAADLWPGGRPPKGLPVAQRDRLLKDEEKKRYGVSTLHSNTIRAAFRQNLK